MDPYRDAIIGDYPGAHPDRRRFLTRLASGVFVALSGAASAGAFAEELLRTPPQTEGPFYPDKLPLDRDNDLLIVDNAVTPAVGTITHLTGRVLDLRGEPIKGARVEIWQVDNNGAYLHTGDPRESSRDRNFQGWGRFETGADGAYRFRTIKPVAYPGRAPHIHVKVWKGERELLTTQCYVRGEPENQRDAVLRGIPDARQRSAVVIPFLLVEGSKIGELSARFDLVVGE